MPPLAALSIRLRRRISTFTIDWVSGVLAAVALVVQVGAVALADTLQALAPVSVSTDVGPEWGVVIGIGIIAWAIVGLVAWRVWERLPALVQRFVWAVVAVVLLAVALYGAYRFGLFRELAIYMGIVTTAALVVQFLGRYDLDWLTFNALGIGLGIVVTALFGVMLPLVIIIPLLVVSATWDYLAVEGVIELLSHRDDRASWIVSAFVVGDGDDETKAQREEHLCSCVNAASGVRSPEAAVLD